MAGELVPFNGHGELADLPVGNYLSSYDPADMKQQMALLRAVQGRDKGIDDCTDQEIVVQHIVCHSSGLVDEETGEVSYSVRTVLISPDGTRYATRSDTVRKTISRVSLILRRPVPFNPPLRFVVRRVPNLTGKRKYLDLELIGEYAGNGDGSGNDALAQGDSPAPAGDASRGRKESGNAGG